MLETYFLISISSTSNTFTGQWIVKAGRVVAPGINSLGTNNITLDPNYVLPVPPFNATTPIVDVAGPAILELGYDINSAGTLTLINGGRLTLHQDLIFSAVVIEGNSLPAGTHSYADLMANYNFNNNFDPGGQGSITVRPYSSTPIDFVAIILSQPLPQTLYAGQTARFNVTATGSGTTLIRYGA